MRAQQCERLECNHAFSLKRKRWPRRLQVLAIQLDRCFARNSKMATKRILGFREGLKVKYSQIRFLECHCLFLYVDI